MITIRYIIERNNKMKLIIAGIKLYIIGIYIDILKTIISKYCKKRLKKDLSLSTPFILFLSEKCNLASNLFIKIEKNFK